MDILTNEGRFQYCIKFILEHEGGLTRDKRDPGGVTQWGISLRFLRSIGLDIDGDGNVDAEDIVALTRPGAKQIYRKFWWDKYHYGSFNSIEVAAKVFDLSVNMGSIAAHKVLQKSINRLNPKPIAIDGILGGITLGSANSLDSDKLRQELRSCARERYIEILTANPAMEWCRDGWLRRAAW